MLCLNNFLALPSDEWLEIVPAHGRGRRFNPHKQLTAEMRQQSGKNPRNLFFKRSPGREAAEVLTPTAKA
jgi:hypothetical protein